MSIDPLTPAALTSLGQQDFTVRVRPVRRAFLVRDGDPDQLRSALHAAMAIWGGGRCPVLPVDPNGNVAPAHQQFAECLGVTTAVDFTEGQASLASLPWPARTAQPLTDATFWTLHPVTVERSGVGEIFLPADTSLVSLAGAGGYGLSEELPLFRDAGFNIVEGCGPETLATAQIQERTAWAATLSHDVDTMLHGPTLGSTGLLWIVKNDDSFESIVWFWNLRALRPRHRRGGTSVITTRDVVQRESFGESFTSTIRRTASTTPSFVIAGLDLDDEELAAIAGSLDSTPHTGDRLEESYGSVAAERPLTYLVNYDVRQLWLGGRRTGPVLTVPAALRRPTLVVSGPSPVPWVPRYQFSGRARVTIDSNSIAGPDKPAVAQLFSPQAHWDDGALAFEVSNVESLRFNLTLPLPAEILRAAVADSGVTFALSDKGQQVLGASRLSQDLDLFRRRSTHALAAALTRTAGRDLARQLAALREAGTVSEAAVEGLRADALLGDRPHKSMADLRSGINRLGLTGTDAVKTVDDLVACRAIEMGLTTRCPLCSLTEFQQLSTIDGPPRCRGCGTRATFIGQAGQPEIQYRLSSLFHTLSLNGGLAPLAAYALLSDERAFAEPGVNLTRGGAHVGELDLLGWQGRTLFAAEAKTSAAGFERADLAADVEKAALVGADTFTMICPQTITGDAVERANGAAKSHGIAVRVMDADELLIDA